MSDAFRPATAADVPALLGLMEGLYAEDGYVPFERERAERALRQLLGGPELGRVWIAVGVAGKPVGYLVLTWGFSLEYGGRDAFIDELYLARSHRGRGLGREALATAEAACRERGAGALHLEVERENVRAQEFYRRGAFTAQDRYLMTRRIG